MFVIVILCLFLLARAKFNTMEVRKNINMNIATKCKWRRVQPIDLREQAKVSFGYEYSVQSSRSIDVTKFAEEVKSHMKSNQQTHGWAVKAGLKTSAEFIASVEIKAEASAHGEYTNHEQLNNELKTSITNHISETKTTTTSVKVTVEEGGYTNIWQLHCYGPGFWEDSSVVAHPEQPDAFDIPTEYDVTVLAEEEIPLIKYKWDFIQCDSGFPCIYDLMSPEVKFINDTHYDISGPQTYIVELATASDPVSMTCPKGASYPLSKDDTSVLMRVGKWSINEENANLVIRDISPHPEQSLFRGPNYGIEFIFSPNVEADIGKYRHPTDEEREQNVVLIQGKRWRIAVEQGILVFRDTKCQEEIKKQGMDCRYAIHRKTNFRTTNGRYNDDYPEDPRKSWTYDTMNKWIKQCMEPHICGSSSKLTPVQITAHQKARKSLSKYYGRLR